MAEMITSRLWKAHALATSNTFPALVEVAAWFVNKAPTQHMVRKVAATPALVDAIPLKRDEGMDAILTGFAVEHGEAMDALITAAVEAYQPPPEETP